MIKQAYVMRMGAHVYVCMDVHTCVYVSTDMLSYIVFIKVASILHQMGSRKKNFPCPRIR